MDCWQCSFVLYSAHYIYWGVYIPKVDVFCKSVYFLVVLYVCPGCWFGCGGLHFGLMNTVIYEADYFWSVALTKIVQLIAFEVWPWKWSCTWLGLTYGPEKDPAADCVWSMALEMIVYLFIFYLWLWQWAWIISKIICVNL